MPSLKEIYDDSIRIVKEDPGKIGAHFWLAFTAYRLMQDPNNDGKDFAYRDVGMINFSYQSDSAYQKAMRVYGDEMTLERMQDPSLFWKLYDLFVEDPDLESVNDIRANDRRVYNRKVADLEGEITDITDQNTELNKQIRAINESTPEKQQLISRSNDLLDQRFDKQKAIQTLAAEQAQRSIALAIADEKNGSISVASRKQIDETLAELKQDPYFETRLYLESEKGIDKIIDDPAKFIQDYRIEKGIYDELAQLRDKKDYKGLIDRFEQLIESDNDPNVSLYLNAINACIEQKIPNIGVHKEFDNDTKEFITGLSEEFARRTANNSVAVRRAENEMRNRIRSGEFPETRLVNDNTKLLDKLARDITLYQTDAGRKMQAYSEMHEMLIRCVVSHPDGDPKGTIDGEAAREYFTKNLSKTIVETYEKEDPKLLEGMNTHKEGVDGFIREQWFYQPLYYRDGFHLKTKRVKEGESYFENMPEFHKKLLDMSPEEFAAFEHEDMKKRAIDAEIPKKFKDFSKTADYLLEELEAQPDKVKQTEHYKKMYDELKNFQKFGTKDFVVSGSLNTNNNDKSAKITRITMNKALTRFENAAKSYAKYDPVFANKVNGFVWEQRTANKKYLENKPLYDNERELLEKTKKLRADLNGVKYDESAEIAGFQKGIGGENGKLAQLRKKHKDAQLILGSKKYDRVGDVLKWLDNAYKFLEKTEKEATQSKNKDDAYTYTPWLGKLTNVKEYLETLKDATSGYFAHKNKDGQWNGSNKNANKRIGVVREIDEFADSMLDMINKKSLLIAKKLDACKNKGEVLADEVKDPQPKAEVKPDPEELFKQHKEAFANEAAEIWLKNKFISYINEKINATHEDYDEQARQQIIADNAGKMNEYIAQNMGALKNDAAFKSFMDRIEKEGDIEKMRQYAQSDNGSKLYRIINGEKIIENEIVDLDKKILTAQAELTGKKVKLPDNEYPNPGHKENFESYTTIITAYYIKAHKQEFGDNVTNETFDNMKETIKGKKVTRNIIQNMKPEDLYKKASNDKGQNIWSEYNTKLTKYNERKNAAKNNNTNDLNKTTGVVDNQNGNNLNGTIVNNNTIVIGK